MNAPPSAEDLQAIVEQLCSMTELWAGGRSAVWTQTTLAELPQQQTTALGLPAPFSRLAFLKWFGQGLGINNLNQSILLLINFLVLLLLPSGQKWV